MSQARDAVQSRPDLADQCLGPAVPLGEQRIELGEPGGEGGAFAPDLPVMLEQASEVVVQMVKALRAMKLEPMKVLNDRLRALENEADRLMLELYRDIYSGRLDNLQMFLLKEFFEILEKAIDRCREAGVVAYQIVLKNS